MTVIPLIGPQTRQLHEGMLGMEVHNPRISLISKFLAQGNDFQAF